MTKKDLYTSPQVELLEMDYAEPVCQAASETGTLPDFTLDDYTPTWN